MGRYKPYCGERSFPLWPRDRKNEATVTEMPRVSKHKKTQSYSKEHNLTDQVTMAGIKFAQVNTNGKPITSDNYNN